MEDLAALLQLAKDAGIQPIIGLPTGMVNLLLPEAAQPGYACRQEDGTVLPLWRSEIFRQTVDFVKEWQDAGYFADRRMMADTDYLLQPNWLLSYARASAATLPGVDLLPLTLQGQQGIAFGGMNTVSGRAFKYACDKPEALVTLMDWTLAKTENNSLMQFGQEDKDYKLVDENTVRRLVERYDWVTQSFAASWLYPLPMEDCANPGLVTEINEAVSKAQELRSSQGRGLVSLPQNTKRFAKPGSELANAWECVPDACGVIAEVRFIDGLDWQEMEQPDGTKPIRVVRFQSLQEYDAEAAPYLKLLQAWLDGGYNPLADMVAAGAK